MRYRIDEVSVDEATGFLYLSLSFWLTALGQASGRPPFLQNDFVIQVPPPVVQTLTWRDDGYALGTDGNWYDPSAGEPACGWSYRQVDIDQRAYVRGIIVDWVKQAASSRWGGDMRTPGSGRLRQARAGDQLMTMFAAWQRTDADA